MAGLPFTNIEFDLHQRCEYIIQLTEAEKISHCREESIHSPFVSFGWTHKAIF